MSFEEKQIESIAAIILAAGGSSRFGKAKQLLSWKEDTFINTVIAIASKAGLTPIVVVLGAEAKSISSTIESKEQDQMKIVLNPYWAQGQSSSIRLGVQTLLKEKPDTLGAFFLQVDQPHTPITLIELMKKEALTGVPIVAPIVKGELLSPVYFSKVCFEKLKQIEGDHGGKTIFPFFEVRTVEWQDERQGMDIDTPEDYEQLRKLYGINGTHQV